MTVRVTLNWNMDSKPLSIAVSYGGTFTSEDIEALRHDLTVDVCSLAEDHDYTLEFVGQEEAVDGTD